MKTFTKTNITHKILSVVLNLLLIFYSVAPGVSASLVYAQEATPAAAVEETPSPTAEPTPSPELSPIPTVLPEASPEITPSPSPSSEPLPTDQVENNTSPEPTVGQPNAPPEESPIPSLTPEASPVVDIEQPAQGHLSATILENTDAQSLALDLSTQDVSSASLITDKADYAPTDTAVITGSDFPKQADLKLIITADNYRFEDNVTTDENGQFIYTYQLDGTYRPLYIVEAYDLSGTLLATVTFTDSPDSFTYTLQGLVFGQDPTVSGNWTTGNVCQGGGGCYTEGDDVPSRLTITGLTNGNSYSVVIQHDYDDGSGQLGYLSFHNDSPVVADVGATGATISYLSPDVSCGSGNTCKNYTLGFTANASTAVIYWDSLLSLDAADWNGASLHFRLESGIGGENVGNKEVPIQVNQILFLPSITLTKVVDSGSATPDQWSFNVSPAINGMSTYPIPSGQSSVTIDNVSPDGNYTVTETGPVGYQFVSGTGANCNFSGSTATASVAAGDPATNASCTFHNALSQGTLRVIKSVTNDSGGAAVPGDFNLHVKSGGVDVSGSPAVGSATGTVYTLPVGTYVVNEDIPPAGYTQTGFSGDCDSQGSVTVAAGIEKTCTITNDDQAGTLIVRKVVTNDNGGTKTAANFSFQVNGGSAVPFEADGQNDLTVSAGTYNVTEPPVLGYTTTYDNCSDINIPNGGSATCTITNNDQSGTLIVKKVVTNDNGGTLDTEDFSFEVNGSQAQSFEADGQNDLTVDAGTYNIVEPAVSGYDTTYNNCSNVVIPNGGSATCTITNNDTAAHLIVIKHVVNDNGGNAAASDFTMTINGVTASDGNSFAGAESPGTNKTLTSVGSYNVTESGPSGYSSSTSVDCSGTITLGETKTCTITNNDNAPTITLIKEVTNDNGGTAGPNDFGISVGGQSVTSGVPQSVDANTPIAINESGFIGYSFVSITGDGKCPQDLGGTVTLDEDEDITCTITNNDDESSLTLIKEVKNDNGGAAQPMDWTLTASGPTGFSGSGPSVSNDSSFDAGNYDLSESGGPSGYTASNWVCEGGNQTDGDTVIVGLGQNVICTITNDDEEGTLIVRKIVKNDNGGTLEAQDFSFQVNGGIEVSFEADGENVQGVDAGTYTITEPSVDGYDTSYDNCQDIVIANGDTQVCTITNDDIAPILTLIKNLPNDNGGTATQEDFNVYIDGQPAIWGQNTVEAGDLTVSEDTLPGYESSTWSGDCDEDGNITLLPGDEKTCEITNNDRPVEIHGMKFEDHDGDGIKDPEDHGLSDWTIFLDTNGNGVLDDGETSTVTDLSGNYSFTVLAAGTYKVREVLKSGWTQTTANPAPVDLANGGSADGIDFGNFKQAEISGKKFNDLNGNHVRNAGEPGLENWVIKLDKQNDINAPLCPGGDVVGQYCVTTTNSSGNYAFFGLETGTYIVSEQLQPGWVQTSPESNNGTYILTLESGDCLCGKDFGNQGKGTITVYKNVDSDGDGQVDQENVTDWTWDIADGQQDISTGDNSQEVAAGIYIISEDQKDDYHVTAIECNNEEEYESSESIEVSVEPGQNLVCTFTNTRDTGKITIFKNLDNNGDGDTDDEGDVQGAINWTWDIADGEQNISTGQTKTLPIGTYTVSEDQQDGYKLLGWTCSNEQTGTTNSIEINTTSESEITCTFTNQLLPPVLTLTKTNDKTGIDVSAGANVRYTLTVSLTGSPVSNVSVIDLPPAGFIYRLGSWTASSSVRGDLKVLGITTEPTYASPGTWNLGDMIGGEVVNLTYIADIDSSTDPGLYKDLAWAKGTGFDEAAVLANAENPGFVDENFVGTEVNVVKSLGESAGVEIVREERGEVLGISAELPATGINTVWVVLATLLLSGGAGLILAGITLRRKYE